ncbi:hypothetical protein OQA88_9501 [Cercophora sp. LCS_1]
MADTLPDFELTSALSTRYITGRPSTSNPHNPRGKHHRRPLPWDRKKLVKADAWHEDGHEYRDYLWDLKRQKQGQPLRLALPTRSQSKPKPKPSSNSNSKNRNRNGGKNEEQDKNKSESNNMNNKNNKNNSDKKRLKINKPHYMTLFHVHARTRRSINFRCGCEYDDPYLINEARLREQRGDCRAAMRDGIDDLLHAESGICEWETDGHGGDGEIEPSLSTLPVYVVKCRPARRRAQRRRDASDGELADGWEWEFLAKNELVLGDGGGSGSERDSEWVSVSGGVGPVDEHSGVEADGEGNAR